MTTSRGCKVAGGPAQKQLRSTIPVRVRPVLNFCCLPCNYAHVPRFEIACLVKFESLEWCLLPSHGSRLRINRKYRQLHLSVHIPVVAFASYTIVLLEFFASYTIVLHHDALRYVQVGRQRCRPQATRHHGAVAALLGISPPVSIYVASTVPLNICAVQCYLLSHLHLHSLNIRGHVFAIPFESHLARMVSGYPLSLSVSDAGIANDL